ncbi:hypothetical protein BJY01DRAFT_239615 [Aspergillus pseudoustus]|uniref:Cupin 2 conserved barrel domain-containing protein n=1 Tax=Aspergillus pseudoustus TaxID=1810923 RepID=A0ABR4IZ59_9EURO
MSIKPHSGIEITYRQIPKWERIPNASLQSKPLMIYHQAWVYSMYSETHFHSTTHEVLGVVSGSTRLCVGGEGNPDRFEPTVSKGDLIITKEQDRFQMVGAYPASKSWHMCYGKPGEENKCESITTLSWFQRDPLYGNDGPALRL